MRGAFHAPFSYCKTGRRRGRHHFRFVLFEISAEDFPGKGSGGNSPHSSVLNENNYGNFRIIPAGKTRKPGVILDILPGLLLLFIADHLNGSGLAADIMAGDGSVMSGPPIIDALPHSLADPARMVFPYGNAAHGPF